MLGSAAGLQFRELPGVRIITRRRRRTTSKNVERNEPAAVAGPWHRALRIVGEARNLPHTLLRVWSGSSAWRLQVSSRSWSCHAFGLLKWFDVAIAGSLVALIIKIRPDGRGITPHGQTQVVIVVESDPHNADEIVGNPAQPSREAHFPRRGQCKSFCADLRARAFVHLSCRTLSTRKATRGSRPIYSSACTSPRCCHRRWSHFSENRFRRVPQWQNL